MSSILEKNFNSAVESVKQLVENERSNGELAGKQIAVQVAYNENTFELYSAALTASEDGVISTEMLNDTYYNMVLISSSLEEVVKQFRDKYIFKLAYADVSFALYQAYRMALMSETGEYTLTTSFHKPDIEDSDWAYKDVFHYSDFGHFLCWFSHDENYTHVEIQADNDLIVQYDELAPAVNTRI